MNAHDKLVHTLHYCDRIAATLRYMHTTKHVQWMDYIAECRSTGRHDHVAREKVTAALREYRQTADKCQKLIDECRTL